MSQEIIDSIGKTMEIMEMLKPITEEALKEMFRKIKLIRKISGSATGGFTNMLKKLAKPIPK